MAYGIIDEVTKEVIAAFVVPMSVISNKPVFASDTLSLKRVTYSRPVQRWEITTDVEPLGITANDLMVNLITKGHTSAVSVLMPQNIAVTKKRTATANITATQATVGAQTVTLTGNNGLIPKGSFVNFEGTDSKVYMVTEDCSGTVLSIYPGLHSALSGKKLFYKDDVIMKCLYDTDTVIGMVYQDGILMSPGSIKLIEKLI